MPQRLPPPWHLRRLCDAVALSALLCLRDAMGRNLLRAAEAEPVPHAGGGEVQPLEEKLRRGLRARSRGSVVQRVRRARYRMQGRLQVGGARVRAASLPGESSRAASTQRTAQAPKHPEPSRSQPPDSQGGGCIESQSPIGRDMTDKASRPPRGAQQKSSEGKGDGAGERRRAHVRNLTHAPKLSQLREPSRVAES